MGIIIIFLVIIMIVMLVCIGILIRKNTYYKLAAGNMSAMLIMQKMFEIMSSSIPANKKYEELNNIIIEAFDAKYSSIILFDGETYDIKATNVEPTYQNSIKTLATTQDFTNNVKQNISKYLVASGMRFLGYKTGIERQIKSAMFSPIYYGGVYKGFWLMEDKAEAAFDSISKEELAKIKDNIGVFIENIATQSTIESAQNTDKQTGFFNNLYFYSTLRQKLSKYTTSSVVLIKLVNLPYVNDKYGRNMGDRMLDKAAKCLKELVSQDVDLVRYSGSQFCMVCPGTNSDAIHSTLERFLSNMKMQAENFKGEVVELEINIVLHDVTKQSMIEKELAKLEDYMSKSKSTNIINII